MNLADMNYIKILKDDNQKLESRIKIKDKIIRELQNDNHKTNKEIYKIREKINELREKEKEIEKLKDINKILQAQAIKRDNENKKLREHIEELENDIDDYKRILDVTNHVNVGLIKRVEELEEKNKDLEYQLEIESEHYDIEEYLKEIERLKKMIDDEDDFIFENNGYC